MDAVIYHESENYSLYLGDVLKALEKIADESIDMVFADPPYMLSNGGFTVQNGKMASVNKGKWDVSKGFANDFAFHKEWISAIRRVLKPNGTIWVSGTYHSIYQCGFALQMAGYKILNDISWFKPNAAPNLSGRYFTASHETLIWARKDPNGKHTFNYTDMKNGSWHDFDLFKREAKQMRSVWAIGTPKTEEKSFGKHPTQKPLALLERIVLASTHPGHTILDPFTGSSTTGLAALKYGRKFIGIDLEKEFLDLSQKRFNALDSIKIFNDNTIIKKPSSN